MLVVTQGADGRFAGFEARDLDDKGLGDLREFEGASSGLLGDDDVATVVEALEPGSVAVMIVYENRWAGPFAAAVRRSGGQLVANGRIPVQAFIAALDAAEDAAPSKS